MGRHPVVQPAIGETPGLVTEPIAHHDAIGDMDCAEDERSLADQRNRRTVAGIKPFKAVMVDPDGMSTKFRTRAHQTQLESGSNADTCHIEVIALGAGRFRFGVIQ